MWSYDFIHDRTRDGRAIRMLTVLDEYTRECLAIRVGRKLNSTDVLEVLDDLFIRRGVPPHIRSDNGSEFTAEVVRLWLETLEVKPLYIEPGSPWENGHIESFHDKLRDELLNRELFDALYEAKVLLAQWRRQYNPVLPHSAPRYRPPALEAFVWPLGAREVGALYTGNQVEWLHYRGQVNELGPLYC